MIEAGFERSLFRMRPAHRPHGVLYCACGPDSFGRHAFEHVGGSAFAISTGNISFAINPPCAMDRCMMFSRTRRSLPSVIITMLLAFPSAGGCEEAGSPFYYREETARKPVSLDCEVAVYGGTPAGVAAAIQAARMGRKTLLLSFNRHVGGMTSGGLTATDVGKKASIGGLALDFYTRIGRLHPYGACIHDSRPECRQASPSKIMSRFRAWITASSRAGCWTPVSACRWFHFRSNPACGRMSMGRRAAIAVGCQWFFAKGIGIGIGDRHGHRFHYPESGSGWVPQPIRNLNR